MQTTRFKDLPLQQQLKLQKVLDRNRPKPTKIRKVKTDFTKHELEQNFKKYLRY
jgi:hypothetical protein